MRIESLHIKFPQKAFISKLFTRFISFSIVVLSSITVSAQTTIIGGATGNGNFEGAGSWTILNGTQTNKWQISTGATTGFSGSQSIYVSNSASAPFAHTYTNTSTSTVFFYQDITIPAGETDIKLGFKYINNAESCCDHIKIYMVPTTFTPTVGTEISTTGSAPTGRVQLGATQYGGAINTWTTVSNVAIPTAYAGTTVRIVFQWRNDSSIGSNPPGAVDDITLTSQLPPAVPGCATLSTPANGATGVIRNTLLTWTAPTTGGTPSGYKVYLGTATNPALVTTVTATTLTYTPTGQTYSTTYYWRIVPTNITGDAVGCTTEFSYTTEAAPIGATCSNPLVVNTFPYTASATTCGFGNDEGIQCSGNYGGGEDFIYQLDIPSAGSRVITVTATGGGSYIGWFLKGSTNCGTESSCLDNAVSDIGTVATKSYNFTAAGTYYLIVDTWPSPNCSAYDISITDPPAVPNCATLASPLNAETGVARNTLLTWVAPTTGGAPTGYKVYLGTATNPALVTTVTALTYTPIGQAYSTTYYWRIVPTNTTGDAVGCTTEFSYTTEAAPPPPANDNCASAQTLNADISLPGTTAGGTSSGVPLPDCVSGGSADDDVWYRVQANNIGELLDISVTGSTEFDAVVVLYSGTCGSLTEVDCADNSFEGDEETISYLVDVAGVYYIRVYEYFTGSGSGEFDIVVSGAALPITISKISAHNMGKNNMITWTTASEVNNDVQIVERSKDGISGWEMVGKVNGTNGSGDVTYEVYDNKPFNISFYRIHSVDFDGQEQMSKIVSVRRDGIKGGRINAIYPNPATHQLTADLQSDTDGDAVITISDITGKVMTTSKINLREGINNHQSDLTSLPSGMYILKVEGAGINEFKKFVKE